MKKKLITATLATAITIIMTLLMTASALATEWSWPVLPGTRSTNVSSHFGPRSFMLHGQPFSDFHTGIDINAARGLGVIATRAGRVVRSNYGEQTGHTVIIDHGDGYFSAYWHMDRRDVSVGQYVTQNQQIGTVGNTGTMTTGTHLHFEIRRDTVIARQAGAVNPLYYVTPGHIVSPQEDTPRELPGQPAELPNSNFVIANVGIPSHVLNVRSWNPPARGITVTVAPYYTGFHVTQNWRLERTGDAYIVHSTTPGIILNAARDHQAINGTNVNTWDWVNENTQRWIIRELDNSNFVLLSQSNTNVALTVSGARDNIDQANVTMQYYTGDASQQWTFRDLNPPVIPNGTIAIHYNANSGTGAPESHTVTKDDNGAASITIPNIVPTRSGYTFLGWRLGNDTAFGIDLPGQTNLLTTGDRITDSTFTYYAQWEALASLPVPPTPPPTAPNLATASEWARGSINDAFALRLIPVELANHYSENATRAEFTALAVALYETVTGREITGRMHFNDTNNINVQKMGYLGIVTGIGNGNFNPNGTISRQEAAVLISRLAAAVGHPLPAAAPTFADNALIQPWATDSVGLMQASGIMGGVGNNLFSPNGSFTREQSIITMLRLFGIVA